MKYFLKQFIYVWECGVWNLIKLQLSCNIQSKSYYIFAIYYRVVS